MLRGLIIQLFYLMGQMGKQLTLGLKFEPENDKATDTGVIIFFVNFYRKLLNLFSYLLGGAIVSIFLLVMVNLF